ncbi:glycosyltransferase family 4 protein [Halorhodospira halophila]|uniref:Glycosyl transferase, group 1 n=1 Tax=Halorhodospira halophila (strain DSM 244 / SL1) TaxID=349124 RepID=A1WZL4_HALHL|nr:glycosyltransferase family 4 protein [Halorhodospira halophila]ABM63126.1 glycosyl transferase, group 1 [Halorhodospira halophila SL1]MBK1729304.1 glycosyltransferase family 1 protein [Halorhodospira halophila]
MRVLYLFDTTDRAESESVIEMASHGVVPTIVCQPDAPMRGRFEAAGLEVIPVAMRSKADRAAIAALRRLRRERTFDLVHAYYKIALTNYNLAAVGLPRVPVVAYRGIIGNLSYWDPFSWLSFLDPRIERIVCVCEAIRRYFLDKPFLPGTRLFRPERVVTIHKGHRPAWYQQPDARLPADLAIPQGAPVIGCVARMKKRKGIVELIRAFEQIPAEHNAHLVLIGPIEYPAIEQAAAHSPAADRIRITGYRADAPKIAGAFDIATLPSLRREGLPRAIIEAMAQGIPAVVSDSGGNPELVEDGVSGRVTPAGDVDALAAALRELVADPALRGRLGAAAHERIATRLTVERTARETLALYAGVLGQRSGEPAA